MVTTDSELKQLYQSWRNVIEPQPDPIQNKIRRLLGADVNPYSLMALGPDVSHWTPKDYNIEGSDFIVIKMGGSENAHEYGNPYTDDTFNYWIQKAWDTPNRHGGMGIPALSYWMQNPRVYLEGQMTEENLRQCTEETHPVFKEILQAWHAGADWKYIYEWFLDYEEASKWGKTDDYWQRFYDIELRDRFIHKMRANEQPYPFRQTKLGMYSRRTFMQDNFHPGPHGENDFSIWSWLHNQPDFSTWCANYPRKIPNVSADEVRKNWLPLSNWVPYLIAEEDDPLNPKREKPWHYWQFSGEPDWSVYNGTPAELYARLGFTPRAIVVPPTDFKVGTLGSNGVRVRYTTSAASLTNVLGILPAGSVVDIYETKEVGADLWVRINRGLWMCARQGTTKLITLE
jgi:hypothetical protein